MTDRELMQQALDALINAKGYIFYNVLDDKRNRYDTAIEALRARLAQPEQEPVAWTPKIERLYDKNGFLFHQKIKRTPSSEWEDYYPEPQREWQGLTEDEIKHLWYEACQTNLELTSQLIVHLARNIEAKLKEKNT